VNFPAVLGLAGQTLLLPTVKLAASSADFGKLIADETEKCGKVGMKPD
jgi:hypothetical protein